MNDDYDLITFSECFDCGHAIFFTKKMIVNWGITSIDCPDCGKVNTYGMLLGKIKGLHTMPSLSEFEQQSYLGLSPCGDGFITCHKCKWPTMKGYCRSCDEFYYCCDCEPFIDNEHVWCRTYQTETELIALKQLVQYGFKDANFGGNLAKLLQNHCPALG